MRSDIMTIEDFKALPLDEQVEEFSKLHLFLIQAAEDFGPAMSFLYRDARYLVRDICREYKFFKFLRNTYKINRSTSKYPMFPSGDEILKWLEQNDIADLNNINNSLFTLFKLQHKI